MIFERQGIEAPLTNAECVLVDDGLWQRNSASLSGRRRASGRPSRLPQSSLEVLYQFVSALVLFRASGCGIGVKQKLYNTSNTRWLTR